jgi:hypothetical protein
LKKNKPLIFVLISDRQIAENFIWTLPSNASNFSFKQINHDRDNQYSKKITDKSN